MDGFCSHQSKSRQKHADLVDTVTEGNQELGSCHRESWVKNNNTEKRGVVQQKYAKRKKN